MAHRIAYMPLDTYPEALPDTAILAATGFAASLGCDLHVSTFAVKLPALTSPLGGYLLDAQGMTRAAEDRSRAECERLRGLVTEGTGPGTAIVVTSHQTQLGGSLDAAALEARSFDLAVLPWYAGKLSARDMAEALVFGSGRPAILVPPSAPLGSIDHIAIGWDESRVAARALGDALPLHSSGGRVSVLTVRDEKSLGGSDPAQRLVPLLEERGYEAGAVDLALGGRTIAVALQEAALAEEAKLLAMGGFGHSRVRDFILGGATKGVFSDLRMPALLAH